VEWSEEASARIERVPGFLRRMLRARAEALAAERGATCVTGEHLDELSKQRPGRSRAEPRGGEPAIVWTAAARQRLEASPPFFQSELRRVAEEAARAGGHLEVNLALLERLEEQEEFRRRLRWTPEAERALARALADKPEMVASFIGPTMEEASERIARSARRGSVEAADVDAAFGTEGAGVEWSPEALARVRQAPEFVRAGIKKAAEAGARREGLARIEPDDLTRFRNRAMMRAVKRMRSFGFRELTFDVFETARERVPRLKENPQAEKRFAAIRDHVEGAGGLGVIDADLLERMRQMLREAPKK
jgi:hypothetical protein